MNCKHGIFLGEDCKPCEAIKDEMAKSLRELMMKSGLSSVSQGSLFMGLGIAVMLPYISPSDILDMIGEQCKEGYQQFEVQQAEEAKKKPS